jgi:hypothetical protein
MSVSRYTALAAMASIILLVGTPDGSQVLAAASSTGTALKEFAQAWASLKSYTCTVDIHEVNGSRVQDRVMRIAFEKPYDTRVDVVAGDGAGGVIVWRGGDKVRGHKGGLFSGIKADLSLHDRRVTTIRGETIADANWGALYEHMMSLPADSTEAVVLGDTRTITYAIPDPPGDGNVTKEVLMLGGDSLPIEYDQYVGDQLVKHVTTSDVKLDIDLPESTWSI